MNRNKLGYRQSVVGLVIDSDKNILLVQKKNYKDTEWDFPGGGVHTNKGEQTEDALFRELKEELGTQAFRIIQKSNVIDQYEWPDEVVIRKLNEKGRTYRGQQRTQYLVEFIGNKKDIIFPPDEIKAVKWVLFEDLEQYLIFPNQWEKAKTLIEEFFSPLV